ncbi:MAG: hypothetical protein IPK16_06195 [Anaerolineales bacterium]|nr:hypothetical protein [Anaerolineales bacterium]
MSHLQLSLRPWRDGAKRALLTLGIVLLVFAAIPANSAVAQSAERIQFAPGSLSTNVNGSITSSAPKAYVLRASAGQEMAISTSYVNAPYQVPISSATGTILGSASAGGRWPGTLPATGEYYLNISAVPGAGGARIYYQVMITITGSVGPQPPQPQAQRINFAAGAVSATVNGSLASTGINRWVLRALAGQTMTIQTTSTGPFLLTLSGADGVNLGSANANQTFSAYLPSTQDYYILIQAPADAIGATYTLRVTVVGSTPPPTPIQRPTPQPQAKRIVFAPGAISATEYGYVDVTRPVAYVLKAMAGQNMTVALAGGGPYRGTITGADGSSLGTVDANRSITVRLPRTQDYYITINAPTDVPGSNFVMTVTVVGSTPPTQTPSRVERIQFPPGGTAATVYSSTPQGYVLKALRGQTMYVQIGSGGQPVRARIETSSGQVLGYATESAGWSGVLPGTQDYYIYVESPLDGGSASFALTVSIY